MTKHPMQAAKERIEANKNKLHVHFHQTGIGYGFYTVQETGERIATYELSGWIQKHPHARIESTSPFCHGP